MVNINTTYNYVNNFHFRDSIYFAFPSIFIAARGATVVRDTGLQAERSWVRFLMVSEFLT
jgi:hypothetical protein